MVEPTTRTLSTCGAISSRDVERPRPRIGTVRVANPGAVTTRLAPAASGGRAARRRRAGPCAVRGHDAHAAHGGDLARRERRRRTGRQPCPGNRRRRKEAEARRKAARRGSAFGKAKAGISGSSLESRYKSELSPVGLLTCASPGRSAFPSRTGNSGLRGSALHAYSGGAVLDFHQLPKHRRIFNVRREFIPQRQ